VEHFIQERSYGHYISVNNADSVMQCIKNLHVKAAINASDLSVPDGMPLILLGRLHGYDLKARVYGPDLMNYCLKVMQDKSFNCFFYGATEATLTKLVTNLKKDFPKLNVIGSFAPPFRELTEKETENVINMINVASPDVLWVGLGCPKQELWMHRHKNRLKVPVMIGVGAAFDFFAKTKPQAPRWMRDHGLEWSFRLLTEPRRLWKRYLWNGPIFMWHVTKQLVRDKTPKAKRHA
jgi:N-acetylglucosaminyldiphosphoundecaprenol N-acetyl-beta-D-mannosaminyltransferase